ncbi:MAG: helix-hairpin-helix domain-containing protein [Beijerinckiaceae bacterium]|nr:helix-hairpin-helix domain-containing protein [Beijerinckiaceae bacterium]MCZ8301225.1 helix-hairpin-helix domain-containing protein [Beijerinckiaceae bacterium]
MVTSRLSKIAAILVIGTGAAFAQATTQQPNTQTRPPAAGQTAPAQAPRTTPPAAPAAPAAQAPRPAAPAAAAPAAMQATLVNLNTATETELDKLPQIGPARAKDIIEARTKNGRFKNWEDFVARNVVPKNAEEAIKGKVRF